jgi:hypothetical protein
MKSPRKSRESDPATEAMGNLFVAGIDVDGLNPFADAFPAEHYGILPILEREGLSVFKALGIRALHSTWQNSVRDGHVLYIADKDFTSAGVRKIIQALRDSAEQQGILMEPAQAVSVQPAPLPTPSSNHKRRTPDTETRSELLQILRDLLPAGIANSIAREISDAAYAELERETVQFRTKREALAAFIIRRNFPGKNFRAVAENPQATKFNIMNANGQYTGYSIEMSALPPFDVEIWKIWQVNGRWTGKEVYRETFQPRT